MASETLRLVRAVGSEFLCTFIFVSVVLAVLVNSARIDRTGELGATVTGIVVGFVGMVLVYCFGDISGAHFNPAITFTATVLGKRDVVEGFLYIVAQLCAAIFAALIQYVIFPKDVPGAVTIGSAIAVQKNPNASVFNAIMMEIYLTFLLVYVVFATAIDRPESVKVVGPVELVPDDSSEKIQQSSQRERGSESSQTERSILSSQTERTIMSSQTERIGGSRQDSSLRGILEERDSKSSLGRESNSSLAKSLEGRTSESKSLGRESNPSLAKSLEGRTSESKSLGRVSSLSLANNSERGSETRSTGLEPPSGAERDIDLEKGKTWADCKTIAIATPGLDTHAACPMCIGFTLGLLAYLGASSSGGAFNIARAFGASVVANNWDHHYIYWIGGLIGGLFGGITQYFLFSRHKAVVSFRSANP